MKPQVFFILKVVTHHVVQYTFQQRNKEICFLRNQGIVFFTLLLSRQQEMTDLLKGNDWNESNENDDRMPFRGVVWCCLSP